MEGFQIDITPAKELSNNAIYTHLYFQKIERIIITNICLHYKQWCNSKILQNDLKRFKLVGPQSFPRQRQPTTCYWNGKVTLLQFLFKSMHNLNPSAEKKPGPRHYPWINSLLVSPRFIYVFFFSICVLITTDYRSIRVVTHTDIFVSMFTWIWRL